MDNLIGAAARQTSASEYRRLTPLIQAVHSRPADIAADIANGMRGPFFLEEEPDRSQGIFSVVKGKTKMPRAGVARSASIARPQCACIPPDQR